MDKAPLVTEDEFRRLCDFLYRRTGMVFADNKRFYIERRIADRLETTGARSFADYFGRLRNGWDSEVEDLVNAVTVNETYFYREDHQLRCLTNDLLAHRLAVKPRGEAIRIWSIPCSTGEEPYSVALWLLENWRQVDAHDIEIVGSDIDTRALYAAQQGIYGRRALMRLNTALVEKYFERLGDDQWRIIEEIRQSVRFSAANVVNASETRPHGGFDVIFCRNVLIYFDEASRRLAAENLFENLLPDGFICLGHTESMSRISPLFAVCRYADAIVYQRPLERTRG